VPALLVAALPCIAGCPGALVDRASFPVERPGGGNPGVCNAPAMVLTPTCGNMPVCHAVNGAFGDFITNPDSLIGRAATGGISTVAACRPPNMLINNTGSPDGVIFMRIRGEDCGTGTRMPMGGPPLDPTLVQCLTDWVMSKLNSASPPEDMALPGEEDQAGEPKEAERAGEAGAAGTTVSALGATE
jgi:hypothetical protein